MKEKRELVIRARHFKNTIFSACENCALASAAKEEYNTLDVQEGVHGISIDGMGYRHTRYDRSRYDNDYSKAKLLDFDDTIIRRIELK